MTNQQILTKAIQVALDRSWDMFDYDKWEWQVTAFIHPTHRYWYKIRVTSSEEEHLIDAERIIFNDGFARALWGDFPTYTHSGFERYGVGQDVNSWLGPAKEAIKDEEFVTGAISYTSWQYHLQQMVVAPDPVQYLGDNI